MSGHFKKSSVTATKVGVPKKTGIPTKNLRGISAGGKSRGATLYAGGGKAKANIIK